MITRFAPSPTGPLHLGHAYSAILAYDMAIKAGGTFLLRIEDIDRQRSKPDWEAQIYDDLTWLGLTWETPVMRQSERAEIYDTALQTLWDTAQIYPCSCNRKDIKAALSAPQEGAEMTIGPDGPIYPGTCRTKSHPTERPMEAVLRLNLQTVFESLKDQNILGSTEAETGQIRFTSQEAITTIGDIVLARRDMGTSYHLSVVLDDSAQGITDVVRGQDLYEATKIHVILQRLLGLPTPIYHHHRLIRDAQGKRLAKRDDARAIAKYRSDGATPQDIRDLVGL